VGVLLIAAFLLLSDLALEVAYCLGEGCRALSVVLLVSAETVDLILEFVVVGEDAVITGYRRFDVALQVLYSCCHLHHLIAAVLALGLLELLLVLSELVKDLRGYYCYCFVGLLNAEVPALFLLDAACVVVNLSLLHIQVGLVAAQLHAAVVVEYLAGD